MRDWHEIRVTKSILRFATDLAPAFFACAWRSSTQCMLSIKGSSAMDSRMSTTTCVCFLEIQRGIRVEPGTQLNKERALARAAQVVLHRRQKMIHHSWPLIWFEIEEVKHIHRLLPKGAQETEAEGRGQSQIESSTQPDTLAWLKVAMRS